jgi:hypothetical protein
MSITSNLLDAMRRLRSTSKSRLLWIDAVCINQRDLDKRAEQMPLMGKIYSGASKVMVWVGEEDASRVVIKIFRDRTTLTRRLGPFGSKHHLFRERFMNRGDYQSTLAAICSFVQKPWFERAWCFQEVVLFRDAQFLYGSTELDFRLFQLAYGVAGASGIVGECFVSNPNVEVIVNTWLMERDDK